jgi:hypothetical protein
MKKKQEEEELVLELGVLVFSKYSFGYIRK